MFSVHILLAQGCISILTVWINIKYMIIFVESIIFIIPCCEGKEGGYEVDFILTCNL